MKAIPLGWGSIWDLWACFNDNHTRLGINYQSRIQHTFRGYAILTGPLAGPQYSMIFLIAHLMLQQQPKVIVFSAMQ